MPYINIIKNIIDEFIKDSYNEKYNIDYKTSIIKTLPIGECNLSEGLNICVCREEHN
jgi:hypothetical protein